MAGKTQKTHKLYYIVESGKHKEQDKGFPLIIRMLVLLS
jgi:hypothetical protein